jgi:hypothetical protein
MNTNHTFKVLPKACNIEQRASFYQSMIFLLEYENNITKAIEIIEREFSTDFMKERLSIMKQNVKQDCIKRNGKYDKVAIGKIISNDLGNVKDTEHLALVMPYGDIKSAFINALKALKLTKELSV